MSQPLVSCVMPTTAARSAWIPRAIEYWRRQTYSMRELVIVSDGPERLDNLIPTDDDRIQYHHLESQQTLGTKRNITNAKTHGSFICHWDDDDWYHPDRIAGQMAAILKTGADLCGIRNLHWIVVDTGEVWFYTWPDAPAAGRNPQQACFWANAVNGNTMLYRREFWMQEPIPDIQRGSDMHWILRRQFTSCQPIDKKLTVGAIHDDNVSRKDRTPPTWMRLAIDASKLIGFDADKFVKVKAA